MIFNTQIFERTTIGLIIGSWSVKAGELIDLVNWNSLLTNALLIVSIIFTIINIIYKLTHWKKRRQK